MGKCDKTYYLEKVDYREKVIITYKLQRFLKGHN